MKHLDRQCEARRSPLRAWLTSLAICATLGLNSEARCQDSSYPAVSTISERSLYQAKFHCGDNCLDNDQRLKTQVAALQLDISSAQQTNDKALQANLITHGVHARRMHAYENSLTAIDAIGIKPTNTLGSADMATLSRIAGERSQSGVLANVAVIKDANQTIYFDQHQFTEQAQNRIDLMKASVDPKNRPAQLYLQTLEAEVAHPQVTQFNSGPGVPASFATQMAQKIDAFSLVLAAPRQNSYFDLTIETVPDKAVVTFNAIDYTAQYASNVTLHMARGRMTYLVQKAGYKDVSGEADLVQIEGKFSCSLVPADSADLPLPCNIK